MLALKPDMVRVELGGFEYTASKVLIGLDGGTLSGDRAYRAIIHPALTEGEGTPKNAQPAITGDSQNHEATGLKSGEAKSAG